MTIEFAGEFFDSVEQMTDEAKMQYVYEYLHDSVYSQELYALDIATDAFGWNETTFNNVLYAMFGYELDGFIIACESSEL